MLSATPNAQIIRGFFQSIIAGTIAGTAFPVIMLAVAILGSSWVGNDVQSIVGIVLFAILVPFVFVVSSSVIIGIPMTLILNRFGWESETSYTFSGAVTGFLLPETIVVLAEQNMGVFWNAVPVGILGALSGTITGRTWWRGYRSAVVNAEGAG